MSKSNTPSDILNEDGWGHHSSTEYGAPHLTKQVSYKKKIDDNHYQVYIKLTYPGTAFVGFLSSAEAVISVFRESDTDYFHSDWFNIMLSDGETLTIRMNDESRLVDGQRYKRYHLVQDIDKYISHLSRAIMYRVMVYYDENESLSADDCYIDKQVGIIAPKKKNLFDSFKMNTGVVVLLIVFVLIVLIASALRPKTTDDVMLEYMRTKVDNAERNSDGRIDCTGAARERDYCQFLIEKAGRY